MTALSLALLVQKLFNIYEVIIVVWVIMSWIPRSSGGIVEDIRGALGMLVDPYLGFFRRIIPPLGMIDFSPVVAIFALGIIERLVLSVIL